MPNELTLAGVIGQLSRIEIARNRCDAYGGPEEILHQIASGQRMSDVARSIGVTLMQLNSYLSQVSDPSFVEAAKASAVQTQFENLESDLSTLEMDDDARAKLKLDMIKWRAEKETQKYRPKVDSKGGPAISINFDWAAMQAMAPVTVVVEEPAETNAKDV